ncbi:WAP four-disulfide core domain protein 13 [Suncus etruscus]|uniref:WAP four-disulfide core domain protein 13 n=1 Tax=Suncus etruscus TaxID=109475 RepID=UPI00210F7F5A|nr:WAP four-disulfide core domain protein 13 [Suncus etruscus]
MKFILLVQSLLLTNLSPQLVSGSPKQLFLKYLFEPPPCRSSPENCNYFCTVQADCKKGLQCCSSFCGIVCSINKKGSTEE